MIYARLLQDHASDFETEASRKKARVFSMLSRHIEGRSVPQVKSHHQKMMKKYKTIANIIRRVIPIDSDKKC